MPSATKLAKDYSRLYCAYCGSMGILERTHELGTGRAGELYQKVDAVGMGVRGYIVITDGIEAVERPRFCVDIL
jgi:hypothetical protein